MPHDKMLYTNRAGILTPGGKPIGPPLKKTPTGISIIICLLVLSIGGEIKNILEYLLPTTLFSSSISVQLTPTLLLMSLLSIIDIIFIIVIIFYFSKRSPWSWASLIIMQILGIFTAGASVIIQASSAFSSSTNIIQLITIPLKIIIVIYLFTQNAKAYFELDKPGAMKTAFIHKITLVIAVIYVSLSVLSLLAMSSLLNSLNTILNL
jgi:hypothetical protein